MSDFGLVCPTLIEAKSSKTPFDLLSFGESDRPPQHAIRPVSQRKLIHPPLKLDRSLLAFRQEYKVISFKRDRSIGLQIPYIHQDHSLSWSQFERI